MKAFLNSCLLSLLFSSAALAQDVDITAQIVDSETKKPIFNVAVTADSVNWVFTNILGYFNLKADPSRKSLNFLSIGYKPGSVAIPNGGGKFRILMEKERFRLDLLDLNTYGTASQLREFRKTQSRDSNDGDAIIRMAKPKGGQDFFRYNLALAIKSDRIFSYSLFKDSIQTIRFTIDKEGKMVDIVFSIDSLTYRLKKWVNSLGEWSPAIQNKMKVDQTFELPVSWKPSQSEKTDQIIYNVVEDMPSPIGGIDEFPKFVNQNLKYPIRALKKGVSGKVFIEFVVERDGTISSPKIIEGLGYGCDEEAIRVISLSPKWIPGRQRGKPVRVKLVVPINFRLTR